MIELSDHNAGLVLRVRAQPGAKASALRGEQAGALKVAVTQVAEKGKANQALVELIADRLDLKRSQVELVSGQTQREKKLLIRGISRAELSAKIAAALGN